MHRNNTRILRTLRHTAEEIPAMSGDYVVVCDVGAYTLSMWSHHCSRTMPLVPGFDGRESVLQVLCHAEAPEDMVSICSIGRDRRSLEARPGAVAWNEAAEAG
ncbi:MAG: hypothetical protein GWN21_08190 [Gammaproteobacteria bacterium]|nr:hypothetical protein [Gammaproteobacteria bacterium]NIR23430.1 hypothetical protein [Gammaproteobacteria bacterium]NIS05000.1 hypothetical protein [Gammaproteobacteria bacterium]NIU40279.1 hypothetical protein [Gammaproteobacteria bacterium]NIV47163.1 hypothetical protein [Gammaproteobacteria bacterium]